MAGMPVQDLDVTGVYTEDVSSANRDADEGGYDDRVLVSLSLSDPAEVVDLLDTAGQTGLNVRDVDVIDTGQSGTVPITVDLSVLTDTQWETLRLAFATGYYRQPRQTSLEDLAEELGVSKSAVSQRLNGAERKLVQSVFRAVPTVEPKG